uniref:Zinc finger protein SNAI2 n=1 Tax=Branchiostoma lanceolatum TaxID=7740 RepID=A0A2Z4FS83_BRALA|nr:snail [Branchiostoma lanceolatum]
MPRSFLIKKKLHHATKKPRFDDSVIKPFPELAIIEPGLVVPPPAVWPVPLCYPSEAALEFGGLPPMPLSPEPPARASPPLPMEAELPGGETPHGKPTKKRTPSGGSGDQSRYQCPQCAKSYSTYSGLTKHKQFHCVTQSKKAFNCKYCDKVYVSLGALKMHIRTHTLPCKCKICGKAFSRPWLLQGHVRTHTGEKPFACPHCSRAFADRSNLRAHLQTHSDIKKYSCKNCSKTFSRMSLLTKHEEAGCCLPNH